MTMRMTPEHAEHWRTVTGMTGAIVVGRKLFDYTNGWGGKHPLGVPVVVLTHSVPDGWEREGEWFTFVSDGIEAAIEKARELAGGKGVGLNSGTIASQALNARLVDEVWIDLVPVLLGGGTPFFEGLQGAPVTLERRRRRRHAPPLQGRVRVNVYFEEHGSGEPLVMLHGGIGASEMLAPLVPALAADRRVILVDLQGHGRTADIDRP